MQEKARAEGLWNLWLPADMAAKIAHLRERVPQAERHLLIGPGLSNLEYAFLSEVMGRSGMGSEVFNCSAPDTGNMEVSHPVPSILSPQSPPASPTPSVLNTDAGRTSIPHFAPCPLAALALPVAI